MSNLRLLAEKRRRIERERRGPAFIPAGPVVAHLHALLDGGWTQVEIAAEAGAGRRTLHGLITGRSTRVHRDIAAPVLALDPHNPPGRILPTGTMRRVQGLSAIGWPMTQTAQDAAVHVQFLRDVVVGKYRRIPREHAAAIERLCRARFLTPGPSDAARRAARRNGWQPVTVWEDIDDPACTPDALRASA